MQSSGATQSCWMEIAVSEFPPLSEDVTTEVCVVGVKDPKVDEEVKAHIVLKEGAKTTPEELKKFLLERLAPYEVPHLWKFRDSLPKTPIGKPDKKALKKEDADEAAAKKPAPNAAPKA